MLLTPITSRQAPEWTRREAPRISTILPLPLFRDMKAALQAVDRDIENMGAVSAATVEQVRAVRERLRTL